MHKHRYILAEGQETVSKFDKTMPEKPRRRYELSVLRNHKRSLFMRLRDAAETDGEHDNAVFWAYCVNKYRNPKGRWTKKAG